MDPISTVIAVAMGAGVLLAGQEWYRKVQTARAAAEELQLHFDVLAWTMKGALDDFDVTCERFDGGQQTKITVNLGFQMPRGCHVRPRGTFDGLANVVRGLDVQVGNDLDPKLDIRGSERDLKVLLNDPEVVAALDEILERDGYFWLTEDELTLIEPGNYVDDAVAWLRRSVRLPTRLRELWHEPWTSLRERLDLRDETDGAGRRLAGNAGGVPLVVQEHRHDASYPTLRVTAQLEDPLPDDTLVIHPSEGRRRRITFADPILEGHIHATSSDEDALIDRLCRDAVRGPLMDLIQGHPGSRLTSDRIGLMLPDAPLDPNGAVDLVLELEAALRC